MFLLVSQWNLGLRIPSWNSLADEIGYFPQMIISSIATAILLLIFAVREFDIVGFQAEAQQKQDTRLSTTYTCPLLRDRSHPGHMFTGFGRGNSYPFRTSSDWCLLPPRTPNPGSTPTEVADWERHRIGRYLAGHLSGRSFCVPSHYRPSITNAEPIYRNLPQRQHPSTEGLQQWPGLWGQSNPLIT